MGKKGKGDAEREDEYEKYNVTTHEEYEAAREAEDNARGLYWMEVPHPEEGVGWTLRELTRQEAAVKRRKEYSATQQQQAKAQARTATAGGGGALVRTRSGELGAAAARRVRGEAAAAADARAKTSKKPASPQPAEALGPAIVAYAQSRLGKPVHDGECWALAKQALDSVGADGPAQTRKLSEAEAYTFGTRVSASAMAPGDIIHFRDCRLEYEKEAVKDGKRGTVRVRSRPKPSLLASCCCAASTLAFGKLTGQHFGSCGRCERSSGRHTTWRSCRRC
jgi:hypothetical protein